MQESTLLEFLEHEVIYEYQKGICSVMEYDIDRNFSRLKEDKK